jgi:hypothetical protein
MLSSDARKVAAAIEERVTGGSADQPVSAKVSQERMKPKVTPTPGMSLPSISHYFIEISDGTRSAKLPLDDATDLLDEVEPGWTPDQLFVAIKERELQADEEPDSSAGE